MPIGDGEVVKFTKAAVKDFLDMCIRAARVNRAEAAEDSNEQWIAIGAVDAYQSVRVSLFDELLPLDKEPSDGI